MSPGLEHDLGQKLIGDPPAGCGVGEGGPVRSAGPFQFSNGRNGANRTFLGKFDKR